MTNTSKTKGVHQVINDLLRHHELLHTVSSDGEHDFVLTDMLTPKGEKSITLGIEEIDHLAECLADAVAPFVFASPDTGDAAAWRWRYAYKNKLPDIVPWYVAVDRLHEGSQYRGYHGFEEQPLFTHPVTPEGGDADEDLARQIASYTNGDARKNVFKAALQVLQARTSRPKPTSIEGLQWDGYFSVLDPEPENDHSAIYLVCPNGLMVNTSCDPTPGLDAARTQWIADALNACLSNFADQLTQPDLSASGGAQGLEWICDPDNIGYMDSELIAICNEIAGRKGFPSRLPDPVQMHDYFVRLVKTLPLSPLSQDAQRLIELSKAANYLVGLLDTKKLFQDNPDTLNDHSMQKLDQDIEWAISNLSERAGEETYDGPERPDISPLSQASGVQREYDLAMKEASDLAMFMWKKFYADDAPNFGLCDTAAGILSQIDNMVTGLVKAPASQASDTVPVSREDAALIVRALDDWEPGLAAEERAALRLMKELGGENG